MTKMRTKYLGNLRTEIEHIQSGNKLITDAPLDNNGKGEFFSPTDIFASSLGSCILTIMGMAAKNHGFSIEGTELEIEKEMSENPRRVAKIKIDIFMPKGVTYSDKEKRFIEATAKQCPVANSLHPDIVKDINFRYQ